MEHHSGNTVRLANVDDFVSPSEACVNPLFTTGNDSSIKDTLSPPEEKAAPPPSNHAVIPRRKKARSTNPTQKQVSAPTQQQVVSATIADCLACSGCVTTAETVLLEEQHNLVKLRDQLLSTSSNATGNHSVVTVSAASWADLLRLYPQTSKRQWVTVLHRFLNIGYVLDGNAPLLLSLTTAAREFVSAYRNRQLTAETAMEIEMPVEEQYEHDLVPSKSLSPTATQYWFPDGRTEVVTHVEPPTMRTQQRLPLISSSCPATTCYIEKSLHTLVPHLSRTASPMSMAQQFWKVGHHNHNNGSSFHLAVMPCHDKKLEATRHDFGKAVDMVVTTTEFLSLLQEAIEEALGPNFANVQTVLESAAPCHVENILQDNCHNLAPPVLFQSPETKVAPAVLANEFFALGSGGYGDYIFRYAASELFGTMVTLPNIWKPVQSQVNLSGRRRGRQRDYYEAILLRRPDGACHVKTDDTETGDEIVLRFVVAYGMQTIQRAFGDSSSYDYLEAMACPGSCLNGGGQVRVAERETPVQTKERIAASRAVFETLNNASLGQAVEPMYTRYHVVPEMAHSLGAAAGVAVQATQW